MVKKVFEDEEMEKLEYIPKVKQIVRSLAQFTSGTQDAIQEVDELLSQYINNGWKLLSTHYLGNDAQGGWMVLYVLTKD